MSNDISIRSTDSAIESDQIQEAFDFDEYERELKCADRYSNCASYAWVCKKTGSSYRSFQQGCRKTCGFCKPDAPPAYVSARPGISLSKKRDIMKACLDAHNAKRRLHQHTPSMIYSQKLADRAQTYAEYLRDTDKFDHDDFRGYGFDKSIGENLYWSSSRIRTPEDAVASWYNEIKNYNFRTSASNGGVIGHFTQLVWQRSNILGCGVATSSKGTWIVARYEPAGNTRGAYKANVHPLKVTSGDAFFDNKDEIIL
ncbi:Golgi-associated plant pathogenesis-related protein 1-like [Clytia hemisphaerica]|uniref:Golgi-associated plant pathogenesis-related protein 1-like n=1 Tax=Clytia hemisphaerica TaxID=252671 RepID=UPI0034D4C272